MAKNSASKSLFLLEGSFFLALGTFLRLAATFLRKSAVLALPNSHGHAPFYGFL